MWVRCASTKRSKDVPRKGNVDRNSSVGSGNAGKVRDVPRKGNVDRNTYNIKNRGLHC